MSNLEGSWMPSVWLPSRTTLFSRVSRGQMASRLCGSGGLHQHLLADSIQGGRGGEAILVECA